MLKLYNSLTNTKVELKPINANRVTIYSCGPTVYDHVHVGNLRAFLLPDLLQRVIRHVEQHDVEWVMNITDIDDKMIAKSKQIYPDDEPMTALGRLADKYTDLFTEDIEKVGVKRGDISHLPRATDFIDSMQKIILDLIEQGIAYISSGSVYFSIKNYQATGKTYGRLVNLDFTAKPRVTDDQDQKIGVADFVLWKASKPGEPQWDFKIGTSLYPGRPGWHIECSAMSGELLANNFDIHTGGVDLKFPHHENELAQCGGKQANIYMHNEHLSLGSTKMSKSLGNTMVMDDINHPMAYRYLVMSAHYRTRMDLDIEDINSAHERVKSLRVYVDNLMLARAGQLSEMDKTGSVDKFLEEFNSALRDDLNTPRALAALKIIEGKIYTLDAREAMRLVDDVFGLQLVFDDPLHDTILELIDNYDSARKDKNFALSDSIRKHLTDNFSLILSDTPIGSLVSRA